MVAIAAQPVGVPVTIQDGQTSDVRVTISFSCNARKLGLKAELIEQTFLKTTGNVAKAECNVNLSASYLHRMIRQGIAKRP